MKTQAVMTNAFTLDSIGYTIKGHTENDNTHLSVTWNASDGFHQALTPDALPERYDIVV